MKKLLLLFILGITYAVDCPICSENLIENPGNPNAQSKNTYACSNKHSFHLTPEEFTQFDQANSTENSKINYFPKILCFLVIRSRFPFFSSSLPLQRKTAENVSRITGFANLTNFDPSRLGTAKGYLRKQKRLYELN